MVPTEQGPSPVPPALFREVGPSVDDWEKYLSGMAEDQDLTDTSTGLSGTPTVQEDKLFLQVHLEKVQMCTNCDFGRQSFN